MKNISRGTYCIQMLCTRQADVQVGKLGIRSFKPGYYLYIGSALNNMDKRISRHFKKDKKIFWHIDYITSRKEFQVKKAYVIENSQKLECKKAGEIGKMLEVVTGFGASDCSCSGHLFYARDKIKNLGAEEAIVKKSGFNKYDVK